ncbi:MAG: hypothetical protein IH595_11340 [Bacteroidales bacterium]|nr:hypothetical protein [Bacteroidales bacterium]
MLQYPPKVLLAFGETFTETDGAFLKWLLENDYPELAALSSAIRGSYEAQSWLIRNKFPHLALLDEAIDNKKHGFEWLKKYNYDFLIVFADAVHEKEEALKWLEKNDLQLFIRLAVKIRNFRNNQTYDYHKIHF